MCGLFGSFGRRVEQPALDAALAALAHRGPDASGTWSSDDGGVSLGHTRLAVIDLSPAGAQPMHSADGRYVLAYNGEVYNFAELRQRLEGLGATFRGHSDTGVLLAGFVHWGIAATVEAADGMFAFACWDRAQRTLTLARDRIGEKPLYYGTVDGRFVFASELGAIRALVGRSLDIDRDALTLFLRHKYVPAPRSIHTGIAKLPAATMLTVTDPAHVPEPVPYWSLLEHLHTGGAVDPDEAVETLDHLLATSVRERMVADVPLGVFLSGGIDSSAVTAAMVATGADVASFTIGFDETGFDESPHAHAVAQHLGTDHTELIVSADTARSVIPRIPHIYDEPFADSSQIPTFLVSELARRHVTVALSGDGGDELFGGYNRHRWAHRVLPRTTRIPGPLRHAVGAGIERVGPDTWDRIARIVPESRRPRMVGLKLHKAAAVLSADDPARLLHGLTSHWADPAQLVIGGHETRTLIGDADRWPATDPASAMMAVDALTYLPDDILVKLDRAAMAVSLETRAPLLARSIVEFAAGLPVDAKIRDGVGKWPLRQVLYRHVPRTLVERPKAGFGIPLGDWLRGPLRPWVDDLLEPGLLRDDGYLHPEPIHDVWQRHLDGAIDGSFRIWDVLMFQSWLHEHDGTRRG